MRVMGIRSSTTHFRYVVLELDPHGNVVWLNENEEFFWTVPKATSSSKATLLSEFHREVSRIVDIYRPDIVVVKKSETMRGHPDPDRVAADASILIAVAQKHTAVSERNYVDLKTRTADVETYVLGVVPKPAQGWHKELADAFACALRELGK